MFVNQDSIRSSPTNQASEIQKPKSEVMPAQSGEREGENETDTTQTTFTRNQYTGKSRAEIKAYNDSIARADSIKAIEPQLIRQKHVADSIQIAKYIHWDTDISNRYEVDSVMQQKIEMVNTDNISFQGIKRPSPLVNVEGIYIILLISFLSFSIILKSNFFSLKHKFERFFKSHTQRYLYRESTLIDAWGNIVLVILSALIFSIILFKQYSLQNSWEIPEMVFLTITVFSIIILCFIIVKKIFFKIIGYLLDKEKILKEWNATYTTIIYTLGILCFIPALFLVYLEYYNALFLILALFFFIFSRFLIFYRTISFFLQQNVNFLFLIIYLCSVEILPYIVLYKGLEYVYKLDIINLL